MQRDVFLEVLRDSYSAYYDIIPPEDGDGLLAFRADYFSRDEKYWVTKSIKIWGNEKNEFAYIFSAPEFDAAAIDACVKRALDESLPRVKPHSEHQYTNVKVVFIADSVGEDAARHVEKLRFSKSYKLSLHGYTELKTCIVELGTHKVRTNPAGFELVKYFGKLFAGRE